VLQIKGMRVHTLLLVLLVWAAPIANCSPRQSKCGAPQARDDVLRALAGKSAQGQQWSVEDHPARVYLISFVQVVPDTLPTSSRTQSLSLSSMAHQYTGAISVLVDASALKTSRVPDGNELLNAWHDWSLHDVVLLSDPEGDIRQTFGACEAPETFLLRFDGTMLDHWNGLVSTGTLALAVERALPSEAAALHASRVKKRPPSTR